MNLLASPLRICLLATVFVLTACGGGGSSAPPPSSGGTPPPPPTTSTPDTATHLSSKSDVSNFMARASFGANSADQDDLLDTDAADWLQAEFAKPATLYLPDLKTRHEAGQELDHSEHQSAFWKALLTSEDELRQRMVFALSQLLVVSDHGVSDPLAMAYYMDVLSTHAFGNYRDLLQDITYSPAMAYYLTYLRNKKGDPESGRTPDENYARELLQLFTIGLVELNMDGTPKVDGEGQLIDTFDNSDIIGLARVFTGLSLKGSDFWTADNDGHYAPLESFPGKHSELQKAFLGTIIPAGTGPDQSIETALDHIFDHPNVAPFVSRQLIQRFTASHPHPDYVERVATAFENGQFTAENGEVFGTGERGDLRATLAAILLDTDLFDPQSQTSQSGKIREPVLRFAHWVKAFDVTEIDPANEWLLLYASGSDKLSQQPFRSPSVFNFYRPGFVAPGTESGTNNLTAPEFQLVHDGATIGFANYMSLFIRDQSWQVDENYNSFIPDYSDEIALADKPEDLADHLNDLLLAGRMSPITRDRIVSVLDEIPIRENAEDAEEDRLSRVHVSITMTVTDPAFTIQL